MILLELLGVWLVLVQTGPFCPHAHSMLIFTSPFFTSRCVSDAFQQELLGLVVQDSNIGATGFSFGFCVTYKYMLKI
jgi:hypothetical protein